MHYENNDVPATVTSPHSQRPCTPDLQIEGEEKNICSYNLHKLSRSWRSVHFGFKNRKCKHNPGTEDSHDDLFIFVL